jgi:protein phosphatase
MANRHDSDTGQYDLGEIRRQIAGARSDTRPAADATLAYGALSHQGLVRSNNEDHYLVARLSRQADVLLTNLPASYAPRRFEQSAYALAVADGMGGAAAGEVASALALSLGASLTLDASRWQLDLDDKAAGRLKERVSEFFRLIDRALTERASREPGLAGMGTTLTVAYVVGLEAMVFHIGDSRAYLWRRGALTQLTRDETLAQALADSGEITADAVATHPMRHVLMRAMGVGTGEASATIYPVRLERGDWLLLCSDGLTDQVKDGAIADVIAQATGPDSACQALVEAALTAGGHDNVTVVLAQLS